MGSLNKTSLGFNNWVGSDTVQRVDFVNDNILLDNLLQPTPLLEQIKKVDGNGSGLISDSCANNSATATKLINARKIKIAGDITGESTFDGTADVTINTLQNNLITSGNGWLKFADGTIIQNGVSLATNSGGYGTINFNLSFIDTSYTIVISHFGTDPMGLAVTNKEKNNCNFVGRDLMNIPASGRLVTYIAIGKWK